MLGIQLDQPILYKYASLRFFKPGEHHVSRLCKENVLLLVYDGVLRFCEDGKQYEIRAGEYHIQKQNSIQSGEFPSDSPKYLYVHFLADWSDHEHVLPRSGTFHYAQFKQAINELDILAHSNAPYILQAGKFYELLSMLYQAKHTDSITNHIADFITKNSNQKITLDMLCREFNFSKNHIINICKRDLGMTPIAYINHIRLQKAAYLLEVTSNSIENISLLCGYNNYSNFYKLFLQKYGQSPEGWRNSKRI